MAGIVESLGVCDLRSTVAGIVFLNLLASLTHKLAERRVRRLDVFDHVEKSSLAAACGSSLGAYGSTVILAAVDSVLGYEGELALTEVYGLHETLALLLTRDRQSWLDDEYVKRTCRSRVAAREGSLDLGGEIAVGVFTQVILSRGEDAKHYFGLCECGGRHEEGDEG